MGARGAARGAAGSVSEAGRGAQEVAGRVHHASLAEPPSQRISWAASARRAGSWSRGARLLGPDGIPAEYMAKALQQINRGMASHALIMQEYDPKWPAVTISPDMDVLANGRPYGLLSESEKWRCGFLLALAIASISGLEFFVADRMDVLEVNARDAVINWMDTTAINGIQVIALGTFKQPLRGLPATITTQWIQDGTLVDAEAAAA